MSSSLTIKQKILVAIADWFGSGYLWLLQGRIDREVYGKEHLDAARAMGRGVIICLWHGRQLPPIVHFRQQKINVLISTHRDGEIIARIINRRGFPTPRGSTFADPVGVYLKLFRLLRRQKAVVAITPDGPRGPKEQVKGGIIRLASQTGAPIVTMASASSPARFMKSWDRFMVPYPWSRSHIRLGRPLTVPAKLTDATEEEYRVRLENELTELQQEAERSVPTGHDTRKNKLAAYVLRIGACGWNILPEKFAYATGNMLGSLVYYGHRRIRERIQANVHRAFAEEKTPAEQEKIVKQNLKHYGLSLVEFARLRRWCRAGRLADIKVSGEKNMQPLSDQHKGAIILAGHFGNHELLGAWLAERFGRLAVVARTADVSGLNRYIDEVRQNVGMEVIDKEKGGRRAIQRLREGGNVAFLIDVNAGFKGIFTPFFRQPASTYSIVADLARKYSIPVVPVFIIRHHPGDYEVIIEPPLPFLTGENRQEDIYINTVQYNQIYEKYISMHPEQWFWAHQRWKTRPGDREKNLYR